MSQAIQTQKNKGNPPSLVLASSPTSILKKKTYNLLFWNVYKKDLSTTVSELAISHNADIILLAELKKNDVEIYENELIKNKYVLRTSRTSKVKIFDRISNDAVTSTLKQGNRSTSLVYEINDEKVLISGIHLYSKVSMINDETRKGFANEELKKINEIEDDLSIQKTIIIGDFNMNPYESGMIDFFGLHTTMCRRTALKEDRIIAGVSKRYLFNPSWQAYASVAISGEPPGTIYFDKDAYNSITYYWNLLDQVVISPKLIADSKDFKILTGTPSGDKCLLKDSLPDFEGFSDHLPILYSIDL